jgi:hypothetical protein
LPDPSPPENAFKPNPTSSSALRSAFWRYYDHLGGLTLLSAAWSASLGLTMFLAVKTWPSTAAWTVRFFMAVSVLGVVSILTAGFGRWVFGFMVEGKPSPRIWMVGVKRFSVRIFVLTIVVVSLTAIANNALVWYLHWTRMGSLWGWIPAALSAFLLTALFLSSVWYLPTLFFRDDPAWRVLWRSFLLLLGHPAETLALSLGTACLLALYWKAPATGLLLGGPLLLSVPCTALEKLLWRYTITFEGMAPEAVKARWDREEVRGWRELLKPWENR